MPLSEGGYDIQRLEGSDEKRWTSRCEVIDRGLIDLLAIRPEYPALLGPLRMRTDVEFGSIADSSLNSPGGAPGDHPGDFAVPLAAGAPAAAPAMLAASVLTGVRTPVTEFIQELTQPAERVTVEAPGGGALTIGLCGGKAVATAVDAGALARMQIDAPQIDTVVVYVVSPQQVEICAYQRSQAPGDPWAQAPYVVRGLTLPIKETDPTLTTPTLEFQAAKKRLLAGETLQQTDFARLVATLRPAAGNASLGRSGARTVLVRSAADQDYEQLTLDSQLSALVVHPKARRVLGFGFVDRRGLVAGRTYTYRLTGRFESADLEDAIYDVHQVAASTTLPAAFWIRDVSFQFQTPVKVVLDPSPSATALQDASRRGIRIDSSGYDSSWTLPRLESWDAIITLPRPVQSLVLEIGSGHKFAYAAGAPWAFGSPTTTPMPAGPLVELTFGSPVMQVRLQGTGTLYGVRIPSGAHRIVEIHAYTQPITFAAEPLPAPPLVLTAYNLQQPPAALIGPIDESTTVPPRPPSGFRLNWVPAPVGGMTVWPTDLETGPPLDSIAYQIEHRVVTGPSTHGPWEPIGADDNLTVGSRDSVSQSISLEYGCDLDTLFPGAREKPPAGGFVLHASDVFGETDPTTGITRPGQPLGSNHQYQIRAMDAVARVSATDTLSNVVRLEKHTPPPLPTGPQPPPSPDASGRLRAPPGPRARAIVKGAPGLTAADVTLLGTHQNAILLEWGWRQAERDLDATAAEFRVYLSPPPDVVNANVTAVGSAASHWQLTMTTDLSLVGDELVGQWITSGGCPFLVTQNDAGTSPTIVVEQSTLDPSRQPASGPLVFGRPLRPEHQRPAGWSQRAAIYPLTASDTYRHVFYDVLNLSESHPRDVVWVGVSAADAQTYVPDERTSGTNANRPGNESAVASCTVAQRYRGQPVFSVPPPLGDVPEQVTDEPTGRQVLAALDVGALLGGALPPGAPIVLERCSSDDILSRTSLSGTNVILEHADGTQETIAFPNPADRSAVLATLSSTHPERLANKYLLHMIVASTNPTGFFQRIRGDIDQVGVVDDRLAPKPGRFFYFVRAADTLGHVSEGGAVLPIVVRVPSTARAVTPTKRALTTTDTSLTFRAAFAPDPDTTVALLFALIVPPGATPPPPGETQLLRIPNRRDLYPNDGLRLRLADGRLVSPTRVKQLADADVTVEADGTRVAELTVTAAKGSWATVWCFGLTRDGMPSFPTGPASMGVRA